eukprot:894660-Rhodomonas_salina.1
MALADPTHHTTSTFSCPCLPQSSDPSGRHRVFYASRTSSRPPSLGARRPSRPAPWPPSHEVQPVSAAWCFCFGWSV